VLQSPDFPGGRVGLSISGFLIRLIYTTKTHKEMAMAQFMMFIRGGGDYASFSPEQVQQTLQKYRDWSEALHQQKRLVSAERLKDEAKVLRVHDGQIVVDGPFAETKEGIGGYYLIEAANEAEAIQIAKSCPIFAEKGGSIELREIEHM
jgi:hypothetical protein